MRTKNQKSILVTGIGGNVGQGILRIIRSYYNDIKIIGVNTIEFNPGNCWVDVFYKVPYAVNREEYILKMVEICKIESVDLIIPSTDFETYFLSLSSELFNCRIACNNSEITEICLDKFKTFTEFQKKNVPFLNCFLPTQYQNQFHKMIAKPREGRGSRGILIDFPDFQILDDNDYLIQEFKEGKEITTAVYVSYKTKKLLGFINLERKLKNGMTIECKVNKEFNNVTENYIIEMLNNFDFEGSFNIQSIITSNDEINPFEINCRISGTNSIRHHFGFMDVVYTIKELLFDESIETPVINNGLAIRYYADLIYPDGLESHNRTDNFILF
jgi:carbamoyl-phosphate synthase large subunit